MSGRVIVVGSVNVDLVVSSARLPSPGETVTGGTFEEHPGGKGGNQAVAAARLGGSVRFLGAVGADSFGLEAQAALVKAGVDTSSLVSDARAATGIALILVDAGGENVISVAPGANAAFAPEALERELSDLGSLDRDVVLVSNELAPATVAAGLRAAQAAGARTIYNPAPADGIDLSWLAFVDVLTPNRGELLLLAGADVAGQGLVPAARKLPVREAVVVTLGSEGALVVPRDAAEWSVPALPVDVVDTTGAGDAFNGALAAALASGSSLAEAVRRAVAAGSLATTKVGAREGMPTSDELEAALSS
ncbi:MAG TPA: ribokinase [Candidatus Limnocylindrales bacterium]|nr:ribokinase [Candidatus Limnocylindrales bacterium]